MATIQSKVSRGHRYWYIVESRRVNGKPRPIVLAYLGKPEDLLRRLQGFGGQVKIKSYSHGCVSALLQVARQLEVVEIINKYIKSPRDYTSEKPVRNNLTAGISILLAAMGRACIPTSKRGWAGWAATTSLGYLLRCNLSKLDSQHFWDMMDVVPVEAIEPIEQELLQKVFDLYQLGSDTLFFDTTNFFTFIATTNQRCAIAQRGKSKQKRNDLRQVGLAMVVTRQDMIPLFHFSYKGNLHDTTVFRQVLTRIKQRLGDLSLDVEKHTLVFDKGAVSKANLALIERLSLHYLAALSPSHHKRLVADATDNFEHVLMDNRPIQVFRDKRTIWSGERTVIVFISENLKAGQLRGIYQSLDKKLRKLRKLQQSLRRPSARRQSEAKLQQTVKQIVKGQFTNELINWSLVQESDSRFQLEFDFAQEKLNELEDQLGFRILMTDRHDWETAEIIKAYHGQSQIEHTFKNLKNPYHLTLRPQFHWTDQKIIVNNFICVLGYLLASLVWREAKSKAHFTGSLDTILDSLNNVRLATILEQSCNRGPAKATYELEQMSQQQQHLMQALGIEEFHLRRPRLRGVGVYNAR